MSDSNEIDPQLISKALQLPSLAIAYEVSRRVHAFAGSRSVLQTESESFGVVAYAQAGHCSLSTLAVPHAEITTEWDGDGPLVQHVLNAVQQIRWRNEVLWVFNLSYVPASGCRLWQRWIVASSRPVAEGFLRAVCDFCCEVRDEVLVFSDGFWRKDPVLFQAIGNTRLETLILPDALREQIVADFESFLRNRARYERYAMPYKRGVLLLGPPGNGKTHCIKGLVRHLRLPCLYVQGFKAQWTTDQHNVHEVFRRARKAAPCMLVLEDLDALLNDENRSFFLNELDGFAENDGIITVATTNHPERLDPAILDRPSRFDRKYHFELPGGVERARYLAQWDARLDPEMRVGAAQIPVLAAHTAGFSYAYLKELYLSAATQWINDKEALPMAQRMMLLADQLRDQMASHTSAPQGSQT